METRTASDGTDNTRQIRYQVPETYCLVGFEAQYYSHELLKRLSRIKSSV